jgi:hypothetical protein
MSINITKQKYFLLAQLQHIRLLFDKTGAYGIKKWYRMSSSKLINNFIKTDINLQHYSVTLLLSD